MKLSITGPVIINKHESIAHKWEKYVELETHNDASLP